MGRCFMNLLLIGSIFFAASCIGSRASAQRLKKGPAEEVIEYLNKPRLKKALNDLIVPVSRINQAHVVMLAEREIISDDEARDILNVLAEIESTPVDELPWDDSKDLYMNVESWIVDRCGEEVGGKIHIGRSRNDLYATAYRMAIRKRLHAVTETLVHLVNKSKANKGWRAQPTPIYAESRSILDGVE